MSTPNTRPANMDAAVCKTFSTAVVLGAPIEDDDDFVETLGGAAASNPPLVE